MNHGTQLAKLLFLVHFLMFFSIPNAWGVSLFSGLVLSQGDHGVKVVEIFPGSPGETSGIKVGDLIVEVDGEEVRTLEAFVAKSKALQDKKPEATLLVLRGGKLENMVISAYSVSVYQAWKEKVLPPQDTILGGVSLFQYWTEKGKKKLDENQRDIPRDIKLSNYEEAIKSFFYALHYAPTSVEVGLLVADTYGNMAKFYQDGGALPEAAEYYRKAADFYEKCSKKTTKEEDLRKILSSLKEVESRLVALLPPEKDLPPATSTVVPQGTQPTGGGTTP